MKFFRNLLVATAAIAAMSATAAFAEVTETSFALNAYDATNNKISVTAADITALKDDFGDQVTVVVVPKGTTTVTENNIYYINQDDQTGITTILAGMGMKTLAETDPTDYEVWVGGSNGTIKKAEFSTATEDEVDYGNVNTTGDSATVVDGSDALTVAEAVVKLVTLTEAQAAAANVIQTGDSATVVDGSDALAIAEVVVKLRDITTFPVTQ